MPVFKNTDKEFIKGDYTASQKESKIVLLSDDDVTINNKIDEVGLTVDGKTVTLPTPYSDNIDEVWANGKTFKIWNASGVSSTVKVNDDCKLNGTAGGTVSVGAGEAIYITATKEGDLDATTPVLYEYTSHK
jgi:hypothetical protein